MLRLLMAWNAKKIFSLSLDGISGENRSLAADSIVLLL